jgi:hypothetical protein
MAVERKGMVAIIFSLFFWLIAVSGGILAAPPYSLEADLDPEKIIRAHAARPEFGSRDNGPVLLRYKFAAGERISIRSGLVMDQVIYINDQTIKVRTIMSLEGHYRVESAEENGSAGVVLTMTRIRMRTEGPSEISFDTREGSGATVPALRALVDLIDIPLRLKVSSLGVVSDFDRSALKGVTRDGGEENQLFDMWNICDEFVESAFVELSKNQVKTGDVYKAGPVSRAIPDGGEISVSEDLKILDISGGERLVIIQPSGRFQIKKPPQGDRKLRINYGAKGGWVLFDPEKGNIVRSGRYSRLDATLFQKDRSMRMKTEVRMSSTFK